MNAPIVLENADRQLAREAADTFWRDVWKRFRKNKVAMFCLFLVFGIVFVSIFAKWLAPYGYDEQFVGPITEGPNGKFWFGTDNLGRDLFSRIVYGAQISMRLAVLVTLGTLVVALVLGTLSGWYGGWFDSLLMRIADVFIATPYIAMALAFVTVFGRSIWVIAIFSIIRQFPTSARGQRALILQYKNADYIEAARAAGANTPRILWSHLIPNTFPQTIAGLGQSIGAAILNESAYSFLNVGFQEPTPSWGRLIADGRIATTSPDLIHLFIFPTLAFVITITAFLFVSEGLRDAADPKLRGSR
jgi:peptide/nickel transport system permease protein